MIVDTMYAFVSVDTAFADIFCIFLNIERTASIDPVGPKVMLGL